MKILQIDSKPIWILDGFMDGSSCDKFVANRLAFFKSHSSHYPKFYRNNDRYEEMDSEYTNQWFEKLRTIEPFNDCTGLNNKIRTCRYEKGQSFSTHQDGVHYPRRGIASKYTFLLYLNDKEEFEGGSTLFFKSKYDVKPSINISPKKERLVIFDHRIWHQGEAVKNGSKYIVRSDLYFPYFKIKESNSGHIWVLQKATENRFFSGGRDGYIRLWNKRCILLDSFKIHQKSILDIQKVTEDIWVSCSRDFSLKLWNERGEVINAIALDTMLLSLTIIGKDKIVGVGTSGNFYLFDQNLTQYDAVKLGDSWLWKVVSFQREIVSVASEEGVLYFYDLRSKKVTQILNHSSGLFSMKMEGTTLFLGDLEGCIISLDLRAKEKKVYKVHKDRVTDMTLVNDVLYSVSEDGTLVKTNLKTQRSILKYQSSNFLQSILYNDNCFKIAGYVGEIEIYVPDLF